MVNKKKSSSTVEASKKSFSIVESLANREKIGVTELATNVGLPKSTVYKHLVTLQQMGYVESERSKYYLTDKLAGIIQDHDSRAQRDKIKNEIEELSELSGEVSGIYIEQDGQGMNVYQAENRQTLSGFQITPYLHASAPGKIIMAQLSKTRIDQILEKHAQPKFTENTITERDALETELDRIQERGIAFDREEQQIGVRGIAVPLELNADEIVGSIYIYGSANLLTGKVFEERLPGILLKSRNSINEIVSSSDIKIINTDLDKDSRDR